MNDALVARALQKLPPRTPGFPGSAGVSPATASRKSEFLSNQSYVNNKSAVSAKLGRRDGQCHLLFDFPPWKGGQKVARGGAKRNPWYGRSRNGALEGRKVKTLQMNLFRPFRALSKPFLSRGSASLHPWLLSCRRSAAEKVNGISRDGGVPREARFLFSMNGFMSHRLFHE
jgi:hypothetical protein